MKNQMGGFSLKNILWIVFGIFSGYSLGQILGAILGFIVWTCIGILWGGLVYHSNTTIVINTILSIGFGALLSHLVGALDRRIWGSEMSSAIWMGIGATVGAIVMFSYGIHFITHPELYENYQYRFPGSAYAEVQDSSDHPASLQYMLQASFGMGTGQFIGLYLGSFAGLLISIRETIGKKQKAEDKKEFDEYSKFFRERLKK